MPTKTPEAPIATRKQVAMAEQLVELEAQLATLNENIGAVKADLVKSIGNGNSIEVPGLARLTVTDSVQTVVDFETLITNKPVWARRVTRKVLDLAKFKGLLAADAVPDDVLPLVSYKTSDPFLRLTLRPAKEA
jgi:hypothetical protein